MRKLLILMLVLGMASAANAAFTLMVGQTGTGGVAPGQGDYVDPVDSELILQPTDYLWVGVHNDTDGVQGDAQTGLFYLGMVTDPQATWTGQWQLYQPPLVNPVSADNYYYGSVDPIGTGNHDLWLLTLTNPDPTAYNLIGVLDAKELHCNYDEDYPVEIVLWDASFVELDRIQIHQIPEPMTLALLGLGGLLLRRRK